jgi:L-rhamnose mutarotase
VSPYTEYWRRRQAVFQEMLDTIVSICVLTLRAYVSSRYEHMCQAVFQEMLDTISQQERDLSSEVTAV